jgi:hypothetical protein
MKQNGCAQQRGFIVHSEVAHRIAMEDGGARSVAIRVVVSIIAFDRWAPRRT